MASVPWSPPKGVQHPQPDDNRSMATAAEIDDEYRNGAGSSTDKPKQVDQPPTKRIRTKSPAFSPQAGGTAEAHPCDSLLLKIQEAAETLSDSKSNGPPRIIAQRLLISCNLLGRHVTIISTKKTRLARLKITTTSKKRLNARTEGSTGLRLRPIGFLSPKKIWTPTLGPVICVISRLLPRTESNFMVREAVTSLLAIRTVEVTFKL